jgi:hypothetical protein
MDIGRINYLDMKRILMWIFHLDIKGYGYVMDIAWISFMDMNWISSGISS